jgi:hypothetical protein
VTIEPYNEPSVKLTLNHSDLYNAMIYPFTRIVIFSAIWFQGKQLDFNIYYTLNILGFVHVGEANSGYNRDQYTCTFSKMIESWRQTWNERTNGITDIQFPFGFVQVSFTQNR